MSEMSSATGGQPGSTGIVRGQGNAPGQSLGEEMPSAPKVEQGSLNDMKRYFQARNSGRQEPTARNRVAEFSKKVEAGQQPAGQPNEPRGEVGQQKAKGENQGDPNQIKEPGTEQPTETDQNEPTQPGEEGEPEAEAAELDDRAALEKYREWEQSGMFPEELESKWLHEVKANGIAKYVDTKELKQGYIRGVDYRQGFAQVQAAQQQVAQKEEAWNQHFEEVRDPAKMLEIYEREGYEETLYEVAKLIATRDRDDRMLVESAKIAAMQRYGTQDDRDHRVVKAAEDMAARIKDQRKSAREAKKLEFQRQQLEAAQRKQNSEAKIQEHQQVYERQLNQLRPVVFKAYGIPDSQKSRAAYLGHLGAVIRAHGMPDGGITRELAMLAARDMAEEREGGDSSSRPPVGLSPQQWARVQQQQRERAGNGEALPPNRMGLGGGKPMGGAGGVQRGNLKDLEAFVKKQRLGR